MIGTAPAALILSAHLAGAATCHVGEGSDGARDGAEISYGTDPNDSDSTP